MEDVLPLMVGDLVYVESSRKSEDGKIKKVKHVERSDSIDGYLSVMFEGGGRSKQIPISRVNQILVARSEDMISRKALRLRYMESMLSSQLRMVSSQKESSEPYYNELSESELELKRTLFAVRHQISNEGFRISYTYDESDDT